MSSGPCIECKHLTLEFTPGGTDLPICTAEPVQQGDKVVSAFAQRTQPSDRARGICGIDAIFFEARRK